MRKNKENMSRIDNYIGMYGEFPSDGCILTRSQTLQTARINIRFLQKSQFVSMHSHIVCSMLYKL